MKICNNIDRLDHAFRQQRQPTGQVKSWPLARGPGKASNMHPLDMHAQARPADVFASPFEQRLPSVRFWGQGSSSLWLAYLPHCENQQSSSIILFGLESAFTCSQAITRHMFLFQTAHLRCPVAIGKKDTVFCWFRFKGEPLPKKRQEQKITTGQQRHAQDPRLGLPRYPQHGNHCTQNVPWNPRIYIGQVKPVTKLGVSLFEGTLCLVGVLYNQVGQTTILGGP